MSPHRSPTSWIIDMVHHNPGEAPFDTRFTDPVELKARGYNAQCFKHINTVMRLENAEGPAPSAEEMDWLEKFTADREAEIRQAKAAGLAVFYHIDLFVLPKRIVEARRDELCDAQGKLSLNRPATLELHCQLFEELFARFPEVDGLIPRVGETYLFDTPFHTGNGAVRYQGAEHTPPRREEIDGFIRLLHFLRTEVCEKHGRWLIHRTWDTRPDRFHANRDFYLAVTDVVEPHNKLLFSIKHTQIDFQRYAAWNPCLGAGRHPQIVEVQCQREYEGKGAYPNYSTHGVIEGFPESNMGQALREFTKCPLYRGIFSWSRGGGWYGPRIARANEFWCDANVSVLAGFANQPNASEPELFQAFAASQGFKPADTALLHRIALRSLDAIRKGKCCEAWDTRPGSEGDNYPTNMWMRDDVLAGWAALEPVFEYLRTSGHGEAALREKDEAVLLWAELEDLATSLSVDVPADSRATVLASCAHGHRLFAYIAAAWRTLYLDHAWRRGDPVAPHQIADSLAATRQAWARYQELPQDHPTAASLYRDHAWHWPHQPKPAGIGAALEEVCHRRLADSEQKGK